MNLLKNTQKYRKTPKGILTNIYFHQKDRRMVNYSLRELHNKFLADSKFIRLWREWIKSHYDKQYKPSIDRIDCKKDYTLANIHCMTWAENRYKQRMEFKRIRAKTVYQLMGTIIVNTYRSISHAVKITGLNQSGISNCVNNKGKTCGGYRWRY